MTAAKNRGVLSLQWTGALGHTNYRLQVGSAPGIIDLLEVDIGPATSWQTALAGVPPGTYYVRLIGVTGCGVTGPSNEVVVSVP